MSKPIVEARKAVVAAWPIARFTVDNYKKPMLTVRDAAEDLVPAALVSINEDEQIVIDFGIRGRFNLAEIESLVSYAKQINPGVVADKPFDAVAQESLTALFPDKRGEDPHNQH